MILFEGLLGGGAYANSYHSVMKKVYIYFYLEYKTYMVSTK